MADVISVGALRLLKEELTCPICQQQFQAPRVLPCHHSFCLECLRTMMARVSDKSSFLCPVCRTPCHVPSNNLAELPTAFFVNRLLDVFKEMKNNREAVAISCGVCSRQDSFNVQAFCFDCNDFICNQCKEAHAAMRMLKAHRIIDSGSFISSQTNVCRDHGETMNIFCHDCSLVLCGNCTVLNHPKHTCGLVKDLAHSYSQMLSDDQAKLINLKEKLMRMLSELKALRGIIIEQQQSAHSLVLTSCEDIRKVIDQMQDHLMSSIDSIIAKRRAVLDEQEEEVKTTVGNISGLEQTIGHTLLLQDHQIVLAHKELKLKILQLDDHCNSLPGMNESTILPPAPLKLLIPNKAEFRELCNESCLVYSNAADVTKCAVLGTDKKIFICGTQMEVTLVAKLSNGQRCQEMQLVEANLKSIYHKSCSKIRAVNIEDGTYLLLFQLSNRGRHLLEVSLNGNPLPSSPFQFSVSESFLNCNAPSRSIRELKWPWGVTARSDNTLVVCEEESLAVCDPKEGSVLSRVLLDQLNCPCGITVDDSDFMYVTTIGDHNLLKISNSGELVSTVGELGHLPAQFHEPSSVAVKHNRVFVCDSGNHRIQVFDSQDLRYLWQFGKMGDQLGQLNYPAGIVVGDEDQVFVADLSNHRIQVFTFDGILLYHFGSEGKGFGELVRPSAIYFDHHTDRIFISELGNLRISVFHKNGSFDTVLAQNSNFTSPTGIASDHDGFLYVSDHWSNCLHVY